jgi:hypothetical protein
MEVDPGSVTLWLGKLKSGDRNAAEAIWNRYYPRILQIASAKLICHSDRAIDVEDIAQSTFRNVFQAFSRGNLSGLGNRDDLWRLLFVSTLNRLKRHHRDSLAMKRRPSTETFDSDLDESLVSRLESPMAKVELADLIEHLMAILDNADATGELRRIAALQLEERSANEIAKILRRRKIHVLQRIRWIKLLWEESCLL